MFSKLNFRVRLVVDHLNRKRLFLGQFNPFLCICLKKVIPTLLFVVNYAKNFFFDHNRNCLLYTSDAADD